MFATQLRDCPGLGVYFASYEFMARRMSKDGTMEALTSWQLLLAGGLFFLSLQPVLMLEGVIHNAREFCAPDLFLAILKIVPNGSWYFDKVAPI